MTTSDFNKETNKIESLLFGFAMKLTRNKENAKDLMQETLMRCYDKRDRFQEGTNFKSWATTVMYNSYINHYRRAKTRNAVLKPVEDIGNISSANSKLGNPESKILLKELKSMVNTLGDIYKVPFQMFVKGYHYDEIAEQLNVPMGTIKSRIFYARKKMMAKVSSRYDVSTLMAA